MIRWPLPLLLLLATAAAPAPADRTVMLTGFDRIRVDGPFAVALTSGTRASARIGGGPRAAERVSVRVEGTTLIVSADVSAWGGWPGEEGAMPAVTVTAPPEFRSATVRGGGQLSIDRLRGQRIELALSGSGTLSVGELAADQLAVSLSGAGRMALGGKAARARFQTLGTGTIEAAGLTVDDLTVSAESQGDSSFTARRTATIASTAIGAVTVAGDAVCRVASRSGPVRCGKEPVRH
jgi:hypothetical protein